MDRIEDVFPIKNGDIPASYVSLPEGTPPKRPHMEGPKMMGFSTGDPL